MHLQVGQDFNRDCGNGKIIQCLVTIAVQHST